MHTSQVIPSPCLSSPPLLSLSNPISSASSGIRPLSHTPLPTHSSARSCSRAVIGHINPSSLQLRESLSTLNFLSFTRSIKTKPQVNVSSSLPVPSNAPVGRPRMAHGVGGASEGRRERGGRPETTAQSLAVLRPIHLMSTSRCKVHLFRLNVVSKWWPEVCGVWCLV